jgi:nicotinamide-nucleotide amidase
MASEKIAECSRLIAEKKYKIAFAESATAGALASQFALAPESGQTLLGGIVCYDACTKEDLFGISKDSLEKYTPESAEVTKSLAEGLSRHFDCDIAIAVTGLLTSGGSETPEKPVGTIFIHILLPHNRYCAHREVFKGSAESIIKQTIDKTGVLLTELLTIEDSTTSL